MNGAQEKQNNEKRLIKQNCDFMRVLNPSKNGFYKYWE